MLGKPPRRAEAGLSHDVRSPTSYDQFSGMLSLGGQEPAADRSSDTTQENDSELLEDSAIESWTEIKTEPQDGFYEPIRAAGPVKSRIRTSMLNVASKLSSAPIELPSAESQEASIVQSSPNRLQGVLAEQRRPASRVSTAPSPESSLVTALLQASHAESMHGSSADLLTILRGDTKSWMRVYQDVKLPCKVWLGERDDKVGPKTLNWLRREIANCEIISLKDEGHNLITSSRVMSEVFESLHEDSLAAGRPLSKA